MVQGVSEGFTKQLEIEGVGFRAAVQGSILNLSLGFSHPVPFSIPKDIKITVADNTKITVQGVDKKLVGRWLRISVVFILQNRTRAKACAMRASRFVAKRARLFNNYGDDS